MHSFKARFLEKEVMKSFKLFDASSIPSNAEEREDWSLRSVPFAEKAVPRKYSAHYI